MVSVSKIKQGLAAFLDAELMPMLPATGWESIVVGAASGIILSRIDNVAAGLVGSPLAQQIAIVNPDGLVDIEVIKEHLKHQIEIKGGLEFNNVPILKKLKFSAEDVDKAYKYIMEVKE